MTEQETAEKTKIASREKKIAEAGIRVLELLKALCVSPLSLNEIMGVIEEKTDKFYRKEVVTKYINTLKLFGLRISKEDNRYRLLDNFEKIDFDKNDLSVMKFLEKYTNRIKLEALSKNLYETFYKAEMCFSPYTKNILSEKEIRAYRTRNILRFRDENVIKFENYCKDMLKLEICCKKNTGHKTETKYIIEPLNIIYKKGCAVLVAYDCQDNTFKEFVISSITGAKQLHQKNSRNYVNSVTFKLKNRLSKSYVLKENEKVMDVGENYIVVSNQKEDRNLLIRRLSRYYSNCEILYPKDFREMMKDYLVSIEKIYE